MITKENLATAVTSYVNELFNEFTFSTTTALQKIGVLYMLKTKFDMVDMFMVDGMIDIKALEEIALPEVEKLGKINIAGINLDKSDFVKLFNKIKEYDNAQ